MKSLVYLILVLFPFFFSCSLKEEVEKYKKDNESLYQRLGELNKKIEKLENESVSYDFYQSQVALESEKNERLQEEIQNFDFYERNIETKISRYDELLTYFLSVKKLEEIKISGIVTSVEYEKRGIEVIAENLLTGRKYIYETSTIIKNDKEYLCEYELLLPVGVYSLYAEYSDGSFFGKYQFEGYISIYPGIETTKINIYSQ